MYTNSRLSTGDGSFGFNAMEIDTAARHKAPVLIVVANNGSWAIEVRDQQSPLMRAMRESVRPCAPDSGFAQGQGNKTTPSSLQMES